MLLFSLLFSTKHMHIEQPLKGEHHKEQKVCFRKQVLSMSYIIEFIEKNVTLSRGYWSKEGSEI